MRLTSREMTASRMNRSRSGCAGRAFVEHADERLYRATVAYSSKCHDGGASRVAIGGIKLFDEQRYCRRSDAHERFDDIVSSLFGAEQPDEGRRHRGIAKPSHHADERSNRFARGMVERREDASQAFRRKRAAYEFLDLFAV